MFPRLLRWQTLAFCLLALVPGLQSQAQDAALLEQYALASDRAGWLAKLIPGTDEYYFFHTLHTQNIGRYDDSRKWIAEWQAKGNGPGLLLKMLRRQLVLEYAKHPEASRDALVRELSISLEHELPATVREKQLPQKLDSDLLNGSRLLRERMDQSGNLSQIEDIGLLQIDGSKLPIESLRELLSRYPTVHDERLVPYILTELAAKDSKGFGTSGIHHQLTLAQLDQLERQRPGLLANEAFVFAKVARMRPSADVDLVTDKAAWMRYLEELEQFTRRLPIAFRPFRVAVLYRRLAALQSQGKYDLELFVEYLKQPRVAAYLEGSTIDPSKRTNEPIPGLNENYASQALIPPVIHDELLVRDYLEHFLKNAASPETFAPYFKEEYLQRVFVETKIMFGIGDAKTWFNQLPADQQRALRERVEVTWAPTNPRVFDVDGPARIEVDVKNVPRLAVRVFRINLPAYYQQTRQPLNTDINLDGLVAATQWELNFDQQSWLRHRETLELKGIEGRGVWIVDIVGGDRRSRCLIARGDLRAIEEATVDGHRFLVLDERQRPVSEAKMLLNGQEYKANELGQIVVPFIEQAKQQQAVLIADSFAKLVPLTQNLENYALHGAFYVHREGLQAGQKTTVMLRARLLSGNRPVSIQMLKNPVVVVTATDLDDSTSSQRFEDVSLFEDRETEIVIRTPPRLKSLSFELTGKAIVASQDREMELKVEDAYAFETIRQNTVPYQAQLSKTEQGYRLEVVGHTGEPALMQPVNLTLKHRFVKDAVDVVLAPDEKGHIELGALLGVTSIHVSGERLQTHQWDLPQDHASWPNVLHLSTEQSVRLPVPMPDGLWAKGGELSKYRFQFIELRGQTPLRDLTDRIELPPGGLQIDALTPGTYQLQDLAVGESTLIEVAKGEERSLQIVNEVRSLETIDRPTTRVQSIDQEENQIVVRLEGASKFTRVHVMPSRYLAPIAPMSIAMPDMPLRQTRYRRPMSGYVSDLQLDDEYRYILERAVAKKYSGNMLPQPSLQLYSWDLGESQSKEMVMNQGAAMPPAPASAPAPDPTDMAKKKAQEAAVVLPGDPLTVEYLQDPGEFLVNLVPDEQGKIVIKKSMFGNAQQLTLWVVDPLGVQTLQVGLAATELEAEDLRLAASLPLDTPFAQTRTVLALNADEPFEIGDVQSARAQVYASIGDLYRYYAAHIKDERFAKFAFLPKWNRLNDAEKQSKYNEFACHELHLFLYFKDRPFFDRIVKPLLEQKKDPQFIDRWLLGADLTADKELWRYRNLNSAERALLSMRDPLMKESQQRDLQNWMDMHPEDPQVIKRRLMDALFDSGLVSGAMEFESAAGGVGGLSPSAGNAAEDFGTNRFGGGMGGGSLAWDASSAVRNNALRVEERKRLREADKSSLERRVGAKQAADLPALAEAELFGKADARRLAIAFRQLEVTKRWGESHFYRVPVAAANAELVPRRAFWKDVAEVVNEGQVLSLDLLAPCGNVNEALLALAVSDLPLEPSEVESKTEAGKLVIKATHRAILVTEQVRPAKVAEKKEATVLIGQRFTADNDPASADGTMPAVKEFVVGEVYRSHVVLSNLTQETVDTNVLIQLPSGSVPLEANRMTDSKGIQLHPFSTEQIEVAFYFPHAGEFTAYGAVASKEDELLIAAPSMKIKVLSEPSEPDANSWPYLVQYGKPEQIVEYLRNKANFYQIDLADLAPRMSDRAMFEQVIKTLDELQHYQGTLWSYGFKHHDVNRMRQYMEQRKDVISFLGPVLKSSWLVIEPIERSLYEHVEFRPLELPRKHPASGRWQIPNEELQAQWYAFTEVLAYQATLAPKDQLSLVYYLLLQHRIDEAKERFEQIDRRSLSMPYAYDYVAAYFNFFTGRYREAAEIAKAHRDAPLTFWQERFVAVVQQVDEHLAMLEGNSVKLPEQQEEGDRMNATAEMRRQRDQALAAALQPTLDLKIEGTEVFLKWQNLSTAQVNYYLLDVELLFTRNPFVQQGSSRASLVEPNDSSLIKLPSKSGETSFRIPDRLANQNVLVEVVAGNMRQSQVVSGGKVAVQFATGYGQLQASVAGSTKPLIGAYVKVYVRDQSGGVKFWKDGYTDLRGRFDYASVSGNDIASVARFSVLILEPEHGALIREIEPPR